MASSSSSLPCVLECPICQQSLARANPPVPDNHEVSEGASGEQSATPESSSRWSTVCTPCGHLFHKACILEWFRVRRHYDGGSLVRGTCPTCRKSIAYHKLTKVYLPTSSIIDSPVIASASASASSQSSRSSVSSAVRRYTQQHLDSQLGNERNESILSLRERSVYNDFLNMCYNNGGDRGDVVEDLQPRSLSSLRDRNSFLSSSSCGNSDCIALKNVYFILSKEYKSLQRKYELEVDVSKMKSILVTNLQNDLDLLKQRCNDKQAGLPFFCYIAISGILMLLFWIFCRIGMFLVK